MSLPQAPSSDCDSSSGLGEYLVVVVVFPWDDEVVRTSGVANPSPLPRLVDSPTRDWSTVPLQSFVIVFLLQRCTFPQLQSVAAQSHCPPYKVPLNFPLEIAPVPPAAPLIPETVSKCPPDPKESSCVAVDGEPVPQALDEAAHTDDPQAEIC